MEKMEGKIHVLALPYPAEGHITPLLHFTKRLASRGIHITMVIPSFTLNSKAATQLVHESTTFNLRKISDGTETGEQTTTSVEDYFSRSRSEISKNLDSLILELGNTFPNRDRNQTYRRPDILVYDSTMPWVMEIAHRHGLLAAPFFTESCAVNVIYYNIFQGKKLQEELDLNSVNGSSVISFPPLPPLEIKDLPCCPVFGCFRHYVIEKFFPDQFLNLHEADWILINTLDNLEYELAKWITRRWPFKTIGPTILKDYSNYEKNKDNFLLSNQKNPCIQWLNQREKNSVVYVSFGTVAELSQQQMEEIGNALIKTQCNFLWTLRSEEQSKLPAKIKSEIESSPTKCLISEWCPQLDVLEHESVACFVTHCGWNSTMEAMSLGIPMIGLPYLVDQMTNAKFIADVWEVGVRVKVDEELFYRCEEIEMCIKEVIIESSKRGKELKKNVLKWKKEIEKGMGPNGSSSKNIDDFVAEVSRKIQN